MKLRDYFVGDGKYKYMSHKKVDYELKIRR